ncbi:L-alanyl-D-glutamate peptidase [Paenibacillus sp. FSL R7-269]|uniref:M15 family metallopeptidase n=1 Tax=Paenibacillus sp. FSL R7-269 TaxID=1226755 RepID=UPI0003E26BDA|nr:M15 family metallopeptidase [Paenibacillus sp. FSL R7-269]ETT45691.1 L-alanyl-D-glutamate peptidase [Paenibacillus sp. FSL R7-269]
MGLTMEQVKAKSAARLVGLHPVVKSAAEALIVRSYACGVPILITQGLRTIAEQDALYAQGRTRPGAIVTNARGGESYHNYGLAVDFALLLPNGSSVSWDMTRDVDQDGTPDWREVVQQSKAIGFEWGGDWTSFKDYPHLQMVFGLTTAQLRAGKEPTAAKIKAAYAVIDRLQEEVQEDMSKIAELESQVKELVTTVAGLIKSKDVLKDQAIQQAGEIKELSALLLELTNTNPPAWSVDALKAFANTPSVLNGKPVIDTPDKATYTEARLITILYRLGLAGIQKGAK